MAAAAYAVGPRKPSGPWGIDVSRLPKDTQRFLGGVDFSSAANAGVNLPALFSQLEADKATPFQEAEFARYISSGADFAGEFGKYAGADRAAANLQSWLQKEPLDQAPAGHGNWFQQHHIGPADVLNPIQTTSDIAHGVGLHSTALDRAANLTSRTLSPTRQVHDLKQNLSHAEQFAGRVGNSLYNHSSFMRRMLRGGFDIIPDSYARHLVNISVGGAVPFAGGGGGYEADYYAARERGFNPNQARGIVGSNAATSISSIAGGVGGVVGAAGQVVAGAVRGGSATEYAGQGFGAGARKGAVQGVETAALSAVGNQAGPVIGGAVTGAGTAALSGANRHDIFTAGLVGAVAGGVGSIASHLSNSSTFGGIISRATRAALQGKTGGDLLRAIAGLPPQQQKIVVKQLQSMQLEKQVAALKPAERAQLIRLIRAKQMAQMAGG